MNVEMFNAPATQQNLETLRSRGVLVAPTNDGSLACGETGEGRLLETEEILARIQRPLGPRVLITGGATREKIDGIRFISNVSTGQTAARICERFALAGWQVTYLHGEQAVQPNSDAKIVEFTNVEDLNERLRAELGREDYAAVIQCAAVSDYTIDRVNGTTPNSQAKIPSEQALRLELRPTSKILPNLKEYSRNKNLRVVGFKLLNNSTPEELQTAADKILTAGADVVVANDWAQLTQDRQHHSGFVRTKSVRREFSNPEQMAQMLIEVLSTKEVL
jgi:phosphopantothenoylcysteine decarboxylase/phosphopantothenate--cysteine ligase